MHCEPSCEPLLSLLCAFSLACELRHFTPVLCHFRRGAPSSFITSFLHSLLSFSVNCCQSSRWEGTCCWLLLMTELGKLGKQSKNEKCLAKLALLLLARWSTTPPRPVNLLERRANMIVFRLSLISFLFWLLVAPSVKS